MPAPVSQVYMDLAIWLLAIFFQVYFAPLPHSLSILRDYMWLSEHALYMLISLLGTPFPHLSTRKISAQLSIFGPNASYSVNFLVIL